MSQVNGVVKRVMTTPWQDKLLHGFALEGDERLFGTGFKKSPSIYPGSAISFQTEKNPKGRWQVDVNTIEVKAQTKAPEPEQTKEEKTNYWDTKDRVIELQSCRNSAIELVNVLLTHEAIKTPAKAAEQYDFVLNLVAELTGKFVADNGLIRNPPKEEAVVDAEPSADPDDWKE